MRISNFSVRENVIALGVLFCILIHALVSLIRPSAGDVLNYGIVSVIAGMILGVLTDRLVISRPVGAFAGCVLIGLFFGAGNSIELFFLLVFGGVLFGAFAGFLAERKITSCSEWIFLTGIAIGGISFLVKEAAGGFYAYEGFLLGFVSSCAAGAIMGGVISLVSDSLRCKSLSFQRVLTDKLIVSIAALSLMARIFLDLHYQGYDLSAFSQTFLEIIAGILSPIFIGIFAGVAVAVLVNRKLISVPFGVFAGIFFVGCLLGFSFFMEGGPAAFALAEVFVACLVGAAAGFLAGLEITDFRKGVFAGSVLIGVGSALLNHHFSGGSELQNYAFLSSALAHASGASLAGAGMSSAFLFCKKSKSQKNGFSRPSVAIKL